MTVTVVVVDDQALVRASFRMLVDSAADMCTVGEAADGYDAVRVAVETRPDVMLMDVRMPGCDGIDATRMLSGDARCAGTRVLILTTFDLDEYVFGAVRAGASGFLLKDTPAAELLAAVRVIAAGEALLAPSATRRLMAEYAARPRAGTRRSLDAITDRERDILRLVGAGLSNDEICERLHITMATTKTHIGRLLAKLAARDRAQLVIAAYEGGLAETS